MRVIEKSVYAFSAPVAGCAFPEQTLSQTCTSCARIGLRLGRRCCNHLNSRRCQWHQACSSLYQAKKNRVDKKLTSKKENGAQVALERTSEPLPPAPGPRPRGRIFSGLVAAAVVLFLGSCTATSIDGPPVIDPPPVFDAPQPPALAVSSSVSYQPPGDVHLSTLRSVSVTFTLIGAGANDLATLEFVGPSGSPYETRPAPLTGTAFDPQQLEFSLPVGGTLVETAQMTGTWKALLLINGQAAAAPAFEINP